MINTKGGALTLMLQNITPSIKLHCRNDVLFIGYKC
jgi:hypothetical protein